MARVTSIGSLLQYIYGVGKEITDTQSNVVRGGGLKGYMAKPVINHDNDDEFAQTRFILREAWNTKYTNQTTKGVTPFRAVTNSGDALSRTNYSCGGSCQSFQSRPGLKGLSQRFGSIGGACDNSGVPPAACNVKYVYDSSDYIRYAKEKAINRNYNDINFGGDSSNTSQSAIRAIRRY